MINNTKSIYNSTPVCQVTFQFQAPKDIGTYGFYVVIRSDCYFDVDKRVYHTVRYCNIN